MGESSKSQTQNFYGILGISKTASLADVCKSYKSLVTKWHPDKNQSNKVEAEDKLNSINEAYRAISIKKREEANACNGDQDTTKTPKTPKTPKKKKSSDNQNFDKEEELQISHPTLLSRTTSRISPMRSPRFSNNSMRKGQTLPTLDTYTTFPTGSSGNSPTTPTTPTETFFSKATSRKVTTPIFYSQSAVRKKPQPIEKKLECTLEELCYGGAKMIKITRDAISSNGLIVEEEEMLMIKVKPGWKKGTKITFEGKGDERPGTLPADIIFSVDEKSHPLFKREGDDLELGVEVPLVQALTGCTISAPLLGGGQINLSIDDIIYPGYEKIIPGQGMPKSKDDVKRGDLILKFMVEFPPELSDEQRSEVVSILEKCS